VRLVIDTNVLVAGLLTPFGPPGRIVGLICEGLLQPCTDARVLAEYGEVLRRPKFGNDPLAVDEVMGAVRRHGLAVASIPLPRPLPDADDDPYVEVGLAGGARCLVTGNRGHFPDDRCLGLPILTPAELVDAWRRASPGASASRDRRAASPPRSANA